MSVKYFCYVCMGRIASVIQSVCMYSTVFPLFTFPADCFFLTMPAVTNRTKPCISILISHIIWKHLLLLTSCQNFTMNGPLAMVWNYSIEKNHVPLTSIQIRAVFFSPFSSQVTISEIRLRQYALFWRKQRLNARHSFPGTGWCRTGGSRVISVHTFRPRILI